MDKCPLWRRGHIPTEETNDNPRGDLTYLIFNSLEERELKSVFFFLSRCSEILGGARPLSSLGEKWLFAYTEVVITA